MAAAGATGHMPAECLGSAGFDGRHHLELGQADMPRIGLPPRRAMSAEDVSQFQRWPGHAAPASVRPDGSEHPVLDKLHLLEGADSALDRLGGDMGITRRGAELGMTQQHLDHPHVRVGLQQVRGEAVAQRVQGRWLRDPRHILGGHEGTVQLAR